MKSAGTLIIAAALLLSAGVCAQAAATAEQPYAGIVSRNMFGLVPIPLPDTNPPAPPVDPPPKITPNGIMTIFGKLQALFKVAEKGKPGQPAKDDSYVLSEGERQDEIEVVKINQPDGIITFNNHGTVQELPLVAANPNSPAGGGGSGGAGFHFGLPGRQMPMTPAERAAMRGNVGGGNMNSGMNNFNNGGNAGGGGYGGNNFQPSGFQQPGYQQANNNNNNIEDQVLNAAKQMALIEQNRIATQEQVENGKLPPLPPTLMTPPGATGYHGLPLVGTPSQPSQPGQQ